MKYIVGVKTEGEQRQVVLEETDENGEPTGTSLPYAEYDVEAATLKPDEKGRLILETQTEKEETEEEEE